MHSVPSSPPTVSRHRTRNRLLGILVLILLILALILTPPLINVNRYRHRIAEAMSQSLGRPVHLDSVKLHLLPMPGFTLTNLVVSEDPAFGSEPTIRANEVDVTLRPSSLWSRHVEFSTVEFIDPSLNLVRNPEGRWNLGDLLVHASRVTTAPTAQTRPGPAPRFPYIEATGGRVNLKLGEEKTPFSLTDADFALWQPSPQQWRIRLKANPARTDSNISDPGTLRLEGTLDRADHMSAVPVHLRGSWHDAPLGEASKLLSGQDAGWRGTLQVDAALDGTLGAGRLNLATHLVDLRRADFVPANLLDIDITCNALADAGTVTLRSSVCSIPASGPQPILLQAPVVDLQRPTLTAGTVSATGIPLNWLMDWLRLFSTRIPADVQPAGTLDTSIARTSDAQWSGDATLYLPVAPPNATAPAAAPTAKTPARSAKAAAPASAAQVSAAQASAIQAAAAQIQNLSAPNPHARQTALHWLVVPPPAVGPPGLNLQLVPTSVVIAPSAQLSLSGRLTVHGYELRADGNASPAQLLTATRDIPQLRDDLGDAIPGFQSGSKTPEHIDVLCARPWPSEQSSDQPPDQVCAATTPPAPPKKPHAHPHHHTPSS